MKPIIRTKNLTVVYDKGTPAETKAIEDISVEIYPEEFIVIFGPSGCGKSTLLYAITGIEKRVDNGEVWIEDKNLFKMSEKETILLHRGKIGIIFQAYNLIPTLTVAGNVEMPLVADGVDKETREEKAKVMLSRFDISQFSKRFPQNLSGGQQQRVGVARALINDPKIIMADEPTGNLDSMSAKVVMKTLSDLNQIDKKTIVLVTHDPSYIAFAHRVFHIKDGKLLRVEVRKEVASYKSREKKVGEDSSVMEKLKGASIMPELDMEKGPIFNVHALVNYFDWTFTSEEKERFDTILAGYYSRKISKKEFYNLLDAPFKNGGMGFYKQKALRLSIEIGEIIRLSKSLKKYVEGNKDLKMKSKHISEWLLNDYSGTVSACQQDRIEEAITKRIHENYGRKEFQNYLDLPLDDGGVGFNWQTARNLSRKLEMILK